MTMFKAGDRVELVNAKGSGPSLEPYLGEVFAVWKERPAVGGGQMLDVGDVGDSRGELFSWRFRLVEEDPKGDPRTGTNAVSRGDIVNSPAHYVTPGYAFEVIDAIEAWGLNYRCGAVVKYVARHLRKGKPLQDLRKAKWYLEREIAKREAAGEE